MREPYIVLPKETALTPAMQRMKNLERIAWQVNECSQSVLVEGVTDKSWQGVKVSDVVIELRTKKPKK